MAGEERDIERQAGGTADLHERLGQSAPAGALEEKRSGRNPAECV